MDKWRSPVPEFRAVPVEIEPPPVVHADHFIRRWILASLAVVVVIGCAGWYLAARNKATPHAAFATPKVASTATAEKSISFAGRTWRYAGPADDGARPWMDHHEYIGDEPGVRLLEDVKDASGKEKVYLRRLRLQRLVGGQWIDDGPNESWLIDGSRMTGTRRLGKFDGMQRGWWPNGNLHVERVYSNNERRVEGKGWYQNGQKQWESVVVDDTEISGRTWTEDGRTFDN
jgi:hypothetical protein